MLNRALGKQHPMKGFAWTPFVTMLLILGASIPLGARGLQHARNTTGGDIQATPSASARANETSSSIAFLQRYGYLKPNRGETEAVGKLVSSDQLAAGIKQFQRFAHIAQTGVLDEQTQKVMQKPRCAMRDIPDSPETGLRRTKRYALAGSKWSEEARGRLTYRIERYPSKSNLSRRDVDQLIERAFKFWSDAAYVDFSRKSRGSVTFVIKFVKRDHGDEYDFDGPGQDLAHAFYPRFGGAIHFDDDEDWTVDSEQGTNMLWVAAHEIGHALGLLHSDKEDAVMWPYYTGFDPHFSLKPDDKEGVRAHYGTRNVLVVHSPDDTTESSRPVDEAPDLCKSPKLDAYMSKGELRYIFRAEHYWKPPADNKLGEARRIGPDWPTAAGNIDAALAHDDIYLFKGDQYWTFNYKRQLKKGPSPVSEWAGIPGDLDAAFIWPKNNKTYFFKGDQYWRYDWDTLSVDKRFPLPLKDWKGVTFERLDAVIAKGDGTTLFVEDDRFLIYDDADERVVGRPRSLRDDLELFESCRGR